jgi:hypothetical protein
VNTPDLLNSTGQAGITPSSEWGNRNGFLCELMAFRAYRTNNMCHDRYHFPPPQERRHHDLCRDHRKSNHFPYHFHCSGGDPPALEGRLKNLIVRAQNKRRWQCDRPCVRHSIETKKCRKPSPVGVQPVNSDFQHHGCRGNNISRNPTEVRIARASAGQSHWGFGCVLSPQFVPQVFRGV